MRRSKWFVFLGIAAAGACAERAYKPVASEPESYDIVIAQPNLTVLQDDTVRLGATVTRDGSFILTAPLIQWYSDNLDVATVSQSASGLPGGLVTGRAGGTTTIHAAFAGDTIDVPVTVTPRPAQSISLTVNLTARDSGVIGGLPSGNAATAWLKAVVTGPAGDTLYCNALACVTTGRSQRLVRFSSLEPTEATISNGATTAGQITALDTTGNRYIGFVLTVPSDNLADTAWVRIVPRPIDSLSVVPGTYTIPAANNGTTTVSYTNNVARDSSILLVVTQQSRRDSTSNFTAPFRRQVNITINRPPPLVTWESANEQYASVDGSGRVTGARNTWLVSDGVPATGTACSTTPTRITPLDTAFNYDRVLTNFAIPATVSSPTAANPNNRVVPTWVVPTGCDQTPPPATRAPATVARGVNCTHAPPAAGQPVPPTATCTVIIRATVTDPDGSTGDANADGVPDNVKRFYFAVNVRTP